MLTVNRSYGVLESLNYPNNYPLGEHCRWTIQTTKGNTLSYSFTAFDVEDGSNCDRDYLKVRTQILETTAIKKKSNKGAEDRSKLILLKFRLKSQLFSLNSFSLFPLSREVSTAKY